MGKAARGPRQNEGHDQLHELPAEPAGNLNDAVRNPFAQLHPLPAFKRHVDLDLENSPLQMQIQIKKQVLDSGPYSHFLSGLAEK